MIFGGVPLRMKTVIRLLQFSNTSPPISFTLLGISMVSIDEQPWNAWLAMLLTDVGMVISIKLPQFLKQ